MLSRAEPRTIFQHPWRIAALVGVVANLTYHFVHSRIGAPTLTVAEVADSYRTLFTPAGYAFALGALVYGALLVYAVLALLPAQMEVRLHDRVAPWLLLGSALASTWLSLFADQQLGPSTLILLAALACAAIIYSTVSDHLVSEHLSHLWRVPFGLWVGWLSMMALVNLNLGLASADWHGAPLSEPLWTTVLLVAAAGLAVAVSALFLDPVVPFVVAWMSFAIAVAHFEDSTWVGIVATLVALKSAWLGVRLSLFSGLPIPRAEREQIEAMLRFVPSRGKA
jgi:translocator protein